mgnify:FL=1
MAVDTRDKRSSVIGIVAPLFPNPDGDLAPVADRQHIAWMYSGIQGGAVPDSTSARMFYTVTKQPIMKVPPTIAVSVPRTKMIYTVTDE